MALTGVGVCMPLILIIAAFAALVGSGGSPRASIYMGKGEHDTAEKILTGCLSLQIIVSIILTVILLIWNENLLLMFGASENTISYAMAYIPLVPFRSGSHSASNKSSSANAPKAVREQRSRTSPIRLSRSVIPSPFLSAALKRLSDFRTGLFFKLPHGRDS